MTEKVWGGRKNREYLCVQLVLNQHLKKQNIQISLCDTTSFKFFNPIIL
jgi:hypothetical protein